MGKRIYSIRNTLRFLFCIIVFCSIDGTGWGSPPETIPRETSMTDSMASDFAVPAVRLEDLLREALAQNPDIMSTGKSAEAQAARVKPEQTLPDPVVSFETMGDPFPFELQDGDPSSGRTYRIMQELPFPGKLGLKGKIAASQAEVQQWSHDQTRRQITAEVKQAYHDYFFVHKSTEVLEENRRLLQDFAELAEVRYRLGQTTQQDMLKAHVEASKLTDRMTVLEQQRDILAARLNNLLHRPPGTPMGKPVQVEKTELEYSLEELQQLALAHSPALNMQKGEVKRNQWTAELARRDHFPDFAVSVSVTDRKQMPEMYGLEVSARVPLYFWRKQRPLLESARRDLESARHREESVASTLQYNVRDAWTVATTSQELAQLYKKTIIPQASLSLESALASYRTGMVDFLTLLDTEITLLEYQLKYYESLTTFHKALAALEPLVGVELIK